MALVACPDLCGILVLTTRDDRLYSQLDVNVVLKTQRRETP